jgi:hypothetical protein
MRRTTIRCSVAAIVGALVLAGGTVTVAWATAAAAESASSREVVSAVYPNLVQAQKPKPTKTKKPKKPKPTVTITVTTTSYTAEGRTTL